MLLSRIRKYTRQVILLSTYGEQLTIYLTKLNLELNLPFLWRIDTPTSTRNSLMSGLRCHHGFNGAILQCSRSSVKGQMQYIHLNSTTSLCRFICGVPQRIILGPLLYILYMADINIMQSFGPTNYTYVKDIQTYHVSRLSVLPYTPKSFTA